MFLKKTKKEMIIHLYANIYNYRRGQIITPTLIPTRLYATRFAYRVLPKPKSRSNSLTDPLHRIFVKKIKPRIVAWHKRAAIGRRNHGVER
jgi:hypothetical protein